jgi:molybdenum cofactor biosynthesis protein B
VSHVEHRKEGPASVRCFVLTVSDTRTDATDTGGRAIMDMLTSEGHVVTAKRIVKDDPTTIRSEVQRQLASADVQVIITTGGTGITARDGTYETIDALLQKRLHGFGELFRMLSYQEIGAAAMLTRACAGTSCGKVIVSLPGSEHAVRLAMTRLILPEIGHLVREATR